MRPDLSLFLLIGAAAVVTYLTRIGGYLLIKRVRTIPRRVQAGLEAVPAAVLTALVAPAFFNGGLPIKAAMLVAVAVGLRLSPGFMLVAGWLTVLGLRHLGPH